MTASTIGILGLGEAGSLIGAGLAAAGANVRGWDPVVFAAEGVERVAGAADVADGADAVLSLNSASDARDAAESVAGRLGPGHLYADANTASPGRKRELAELLEPTGAVFADVALMAPVAGRGLRTPALASGPGAGRFVDLFAPLGMPAEDGGAEVGAAAERKLARSVFFKGMAAAAGEALAAGERLGFRDWLHADLAALLAEADAGLLDRMVEGSRTHAVRREAEMAAATAMLESLGVPPRVSAASRDWYAELAAA